jgi:hypothetical protein
MPPQDAAEIVGKMIGGTKRVKHAEKHKRCGCSRITHIRQKRRARRLESAARRKSTIPGTKQCFQILNGKRRRFEQCLLSSVIRLFTNNPRSSVPFHDGKRKRKDLKTPKTHAQVISPARECLSRLGNRRASNNRTIGELECQPISASHHSDGRFATALRPFQNRATLTTELPERRRRKNDEMVSRRMLPSCA